MISFNSIGYYDKADSKAQSIPLDFIRSGRYYYNSGSISNRSSYGDYWESRPNSTTIANYLGLYYTYLDPQNRYYKGAGFALRCLVRLVWQLPTYSGTKSYQNLLVEVYGMVNTGFARLKEVRLDTTLHNIPLSFFRKGTYVFDKGTIYAPQVEGTYAQSVAASISNTGHLYFLDVRLNSQDNLTKGYGISLRCLVR